MALLRRAASYFGLAFVVGFVLGAVRVPLLVPRLGVRTAELLELPVVLLLCAAFARRLVRREPCVAARSWLAAGVVAWLFLLAAEVGLGMALTGRSALAVLFDRDAVAGPCYHLALVGFALLPWWWSRRQAAAIAAAASPMQPITPTTTPVVRPSLNTPCSATPSGNGTASASSTSLRSSSPTGRPQ